jgi:Tol biopolymer transport system component
MNLKTGGILLFVLVIVGLLIGWQLAPSVEEIQPAEGELRGHQPLQISFTREMDTNSVEAGINLEPGLSGDFSWDPNLQTLTFIPDQIWPPGETVSLEIGRGIRSRIRLPLLGISSASWSVPPTSLVYLWPADGGSNLYQLNPVTSQSRALTTFLNGVNDYSISPDRETIYLATATQPGSSQIIALDPSSGEDNLVLECEEGLCTSPRLSYDGSRLAYEYIAKQPGVKPTVRILNLNNGRFLDLGDTNEYLEKPLWSPVGWLSYYNQTQKGYQFWNPATEEITFIPNETGGDGSWSADGRYFLTSEIVFVSDTLAPRHLQMIDLVQETTRDLSRGNFLEDLNPSFSPLGQRFAFSRKSLNPQDWTPGRQLWIMDMETETAFPLTDEPDFQHTFFAWHPEGEQLAYVRYNQAALSDPPEIWLIQASGENPLRLIINGFAPGWIP